MGQGFGLAGQEMIIQQKTQRHSARKFRGSAETAVLAPVVESMKSKGVNVTTALKYGHIAETLCAIAEEEGATQIIIGRTGHSELSSRVFGSVVGSLAQAAPVPVTIVP